MTEISTVEMFRRGAEFLEQVELSYPRYRRYRALLNRINARLAIQFGQFILGR